MSPEETGRLLGICAAFDRRTIGDADILAWHQVLNGLPYADCEAAVLGHYRESRQWIMPADVRQRVKAMRRDRLERTVLPAPDPELADSPGRYRAAIAAAVKRIADGWDARKAIGSGKPRDDGPPEEFRQARAALPPAPAEAERHLSPEELARRQAAESRREREARDTGTEPAA